VSVRLWIDTDVGTDPDDAFALLCSAGHPQVELVGVSTVDGDTEWRAGIARQLVEAPVAPGRVLAAADVAAAAPDALLAIGPLTNVAALLRAGVRPARVAVMGGVLTPIQHRGRVHEIEHNFGLDPAAIPAVLELTPDLLVCPLDVTARLRVPDDELAAFFSIAPLLEELCASWSDPVRLHDPLAFLAVMGEPVLSTRRARLAVDADGRLAEHPGGRECDLVDDVDVTAALARVHELIARAEVPSR
jgi:purine nucleosidase